MQNSQHSIRTQILQHFKCFSIFTQPQYPKLHPLPLAAGVYIYSAVVYIREWASQAPFAHGAKNATLSLQHPQLATDPPATCFRNSQALPPTLVHLLVIANTPSTHAFRKTAPEEVIGFLHEVLLSSWFPFCPRVLSFESFSISNSEVLSSG